MDIVLLVLKDIRPDWVIVQYEAYSYSAKGFPYPFVWLYRSLNKVKIPILTVFHEIMIRKEGNLKKTILSNLQTNLAHRLARLSTHVVTSIDFYARILNQNPNKISIIPVGSNILPMPIREHEQRELRQKYNIAQDAKVVCTFGNRDVSAFLPTFDKLKTDFPNLVWLICGKTITPLCTLDSRSYIRHTGKMSAYDIHAHLSLGHVFFMPDFVAANGEGGSCNKSGTLACAFSLNIPIIGTKGDMNNALLKDGENILLTDIIHTPDALYDNFKACLSSKKYADDLGNCAKELYKKSLTWQIIATQFLKIMPPSVFEVKMKTEKILGGH